MSDWDAEYDSPLMVSTEPDDDGQYLLFFLRNGSTVKCGYVFADAVENVRALLDEMLRLRTVSELYAEAVDNVRMSFDQ